MEKLISGNRISAFWFLVLLMCNDKIFVGPMTGNKKNYMQAMSEDNPNGKLHLL